MTSWLLRNTRSNYVVSIKKADDYVRIFCFTYCGVGWFGCTAELFMKDKIIGVVIGVLLAFGLDCLIETAGCAGITLPGTTKTEKTTKTSDTVKIHDTVTIEPKDYAFSMTPKIVIRDTGSLRIDTITIDSVREILKSISFEAKIDTLLIDSIATKYGTIGDTLRLSSIYLFPVNTASFEIKRRPFNFEHVVQSIINSTTTTYTRSSFFWDGAQYVLYGASGGFLLARIIQ